MNTAYTSTVAAAQPVVNSTTSIKNLPINLFGSVMGLAGLGLAWRLSGQYYGVGGLLGEAIGALAGLVFVLLTLGYLGKWVKHPAAVKAEFNHPIASNFFGTVTIALLLLSAVAPPHSEWLAQALWILGSALTVLLAGLVVSRLLSGNQDSLNAVPAWLMGVRRGPIWKSGFPWSSAMMSEAPESAVTTITPFTGPGSPSRVKEALDWWSSAKNPRVTIQMKVMSPSGRAGCPKALLFPPLSNSIQAKDSSIGRALTFLGSSRHTMPRLA